MVDSLSSYSHSYRFDVINIHTRMDMDKDINKEKLVYVLFNLWFPPKFKTKKCSELLSCSYLPTNLPFSIEFRENIQSIDCLITSTEEDLIENGYEELLDYQLSDLTSLRKEEFPDYKYNKQRYGK